MKSNRSTLPRAAVPFIIAFTSAIVSWQCETSQVAGGGSDTEVSGRILAATGEGANGAIVAIIDTGYDPGSDGPLPENSYDTADLQGKYRFNSVPAGVYNVWAQSPSGNEQALFGGVSVVEKQETRVNDVTIRGTATLAVPIPDSLRNAAGYVYLPGTLTMARCDAGVAVVRFDSLAQGTYARVVYQRSAADAPVVLFTNVVVDSAGLFTLDPFMNWLHEARVTLNTTSTGANVNETVVGFPALVRLTGAEVDFSQARPEGEDLRFVQADNSLVPFEIEYWDSATATAVVWVSIDTVRGNSSAQSFRVLWGNASAKKSSRPALVFDTAQGFQGVWHLGESGPNKKLDATANGFTGTPVELTGSSDVDGVAGRALDVDGSSQCVTMLDARNSRLDVQADGFYTVSAWAYLRNEQRDNRVIVSKGSAQYGLRANERNQWEFYGGLRGYGVDTTTTSDATVNEWTFLTGIRNGMRQYLYVNGTVADSTASAAGVSAGISDNYYDLMIGRQSDDESQWFDGLVDEVRVENQSRTAAWVRLCYENQRTDQKFIVIRKVR
jgi:hypothetical protein